MKRRREGKAIGKMGGIREIRRKIYFMESGTSPPAFIVSKNPPGTEKHFPCSVHELRNRGILKTGSVEVYFLYIYGGNGAL